ncbi:exodeoxyribonuclease VII large subunit [Rheinheimera sp. WS51]|uniref:exodeoxyribonuclease VII large subunit n=1 Tax=Rheinheimera sp. WS51 TaxID=3425886 RepID=UPI003D8C7D3E
MQTPDIYSVSRLNSEVRLTLELQFQQIWLQAEISNFVAAASGHWYFTLKDQAAQVKVAMFKTANKRSSFRPQNGQQVLVRARISVYEPRGEYQLIAEFIESAGAGLLKQQFEQLKAQLNAEGLFALERKKPLPAHIERVGVITSPTGAAIRDIITVLQRRAPSIEVIVYPCQVQGETAANQLRTMLSNAIRRNEVDVLIIGRGGGSLEDLWCFNDETLVRALAACPIPTVSAVGHEIDFALTDFVADMRAATPSAAAELVSPDQSHIFERINRLRNALYQAQRAQLQQLAPRLTNLSQRLLAAEPKRRLQQQQQRLDEMQQRLTNSIKRRLINTSQQQQYLAKSLRQLSPAKQLLQQQQLITNLTQRLNNSQKLKLQQQQQRLAAIAGKLETVSPLATLARGYSISFAADNKVLTSTEQLAVGDQVTTQLANGSFVAKISSVIAAK